MERGSWFHFIWWFAKPIWICGQIQKSWHQSFSKWHWSDVTMDHPKWHDGRSLWGKTAHAFYFTHTRNSWLLFMFRSCPIVQILSRNVIGKAIQRIVGPFLNYEKRTRDFAALSMLYVKVKPLICKCSRALTNILLARATADFTFCRSAIKNQQAKDGLNDEASITK